MKIFPALIVFCFTGLGLAAQPGNLISETHYAFSNGVVHRIDSTWYGYNDQSLLSSSWRFEKDGSNPWQRLNRKIDYAYDTDGNLLTYTSQFWENPEGWVNRTKFKFTYNNNHQVTAIFYERWLNAQWDPHATIWKEYDDRGRLIKETWPSSIHAHFYGLDGLLASTEFYAKYPDQGWTNSHRIRYQYIPGTDLLSATYTDKWGSSGWKDPFEREIRQQDDEGHYTVLVRERWNGNVWDREYKDSLAFDHQNQLVFKSISEWTDSAWHEYQRYHYTYNAENNVATERFMSRYGPDWKLSGFRNYRYGAVSQTKEPSYFTFEVFPNPAASFITLLGENLESAQILDRQGRVVSQLTLNQHEATHIPVSQLVPGLYFVQVRDQMGDSGLKPLMIQR
ncbi:MAG TPA: hypothetical protein DCF33_18235 [Saprospirales bacterium]|nr:hypothetical protein [Saprospirales bacterium]